MVASHVSLREIMGEAQSLGSQHAVLLGVSTLAIAALYGVADLLPLLSPDKGGVGLLTSILGLVVSLFVQYRLTERLLADRRGPDAQMPVRRYGSLFGALFLSGLAIAAGVIVLIIPGLYLAGRWLTVSARLIDGSLDGNEALRASWGDSELSQLAFSLAFLISFAPWALLVAIGYAGWDTLFDGLDFVSIALVNLVTGFTFVLGWTIAAAAYRCAVPNAESVGGVFS